MLAESGQFGFSLAGEPEPDFRLQGVACPGCGESDVTWLRPDDAGDTVLCERCDRVFEPAPRTGLKPAAPKS